MSKLSENLKKLLEDEKIEKKDYDEIVNDIIKMQEAYKTKEKEIETLKADNEKYTKEKLDFEDIKKQLGEKDKQITDLKIKYIETYEKGKTNNNDTPDGKDKIDNNTNPNVKIDDLFSFETE